MAAITREAYELDHEVPPTAFEKHRKAFVYRQLKTVAELAREILSLQVEQCIAVAQLSTRSMLEGLFRIAAAAKHPSFAIERDIRDLEQAAKRVRTLMTVSSDVSLQEVIDNYTSLAENLRQQFSLSPDKKQDVFDIAKLADLEATYLSQYFKFSQFAHMTSPGIVSFEKGLTEIGVRQSLLFSLLSSLTYSLQVLPTRHTQSHLSTLDGLLDEAGELFEKT